MNDFFFSAFCVALFIVGVKNSFEEGMIFGKAYKWLDGKIGENSGNEKWFWKPLCGCARCMASFWGVPAWFIFYDFRKWTDALIILAWTFIISSVTSWIYKNS